MNEGEPALEDSMEESGRNEMIWGIVILAVAGGITLGTYIAAASGGTYWIAWG